MTNTVDDYLAHLGVSVGNEFKHFGVKGMKWGKRKARDSAKETKPEKTEEQKAFQRKVVVGASVAAAVLAASAVAYVAYDQHAVSGLKNISSVADMNMENLRKSTNGDRTIKQGAEFVRRSFSKNGAWPNDLRTYVSEGPDNDLIRAYGNKLFKFEATKDFKVAGLRSQLDILQNPDLQSSLRKAIPAEHAKYSISGKRYVKQLSDSDFAKMTIETLRRSAWDGSEAGTQSAKLYADFLKRYGYSAIEDLNLPGSTARILLDKSAVVLR